MLSGLDVGMAMAQAIGFNKTKLMFPTSYGFEATTTSAGMVSRVPGKGSACLGSYYDADGNALMGGNNYELRNESKNSGRSSRTEGLVKNSDGSVDIFFGPTAPKDHEANWIQTNKGESCFVYLRLHGPEQAYFDQTFPMNKIKKVN